MSLKYEPASEPLHISCNLLVRIFFIIVMIRWTGLAPWEFEPASVQVWFYAIAYAHQFGAFFYALPEYENEYHLQACTLHPQPCTLHPAPSTLNPQPSTLNTQPCTLYPEP